MTGSLGSIEVKASFSRKLRRLLGKARRVLMSLPRRAGLLSRGSSSAGEKVIPWDDRADKLGAYSVIDTTHSPEEYEYVTRRQKEIIYPLFKGLLKPSDRLVLDYGCGPGRFTADLASMVHGEAVGVDVTAKLIEIAPRQSGVTFICSQDFFAEHPIKFDVIWVCLVLGGIPMPALSRNAIELTGALKDDGLLFLVESTAEASTQNVAWKKRTVAELQGLFPEIALERIGFYYDAGQEISILAGRKRAAE